MPAIAATRHEVSDRFEILGFTVKTGRQPYFEVALATDPALFHADKKAERTASNFYSTRAGGPLLAERGEAVFLLRSDVLKRFVGQPRLFYALATFADASRSQPEIVRLPTEGSPWINLSAYTGRSHRRAMSIRSYQNGRATNGNGYGAAKPEELEWAGDAARPGLEAIPAPQRSVTPGSSTEPSAPGAPATQSSFRSSIAYDDGYGPMPLEALQGTDEDAGIEGPLEEDAFAQGLAYAPVRPFTNSPEYPNASRFIEARWFGVPSRPRTINRIVIHITDGQAQAENTARYFQDPMWWLPIDVENGEPQVEMENGVVKRFRFKGKWKDCVNGRTKVEGGKTKGLTRVTGSAHYVVGQDGEVIQMVKHAHIAYHANTANSDSIGIEHNARTPGTFGKKDAGLFPSDDQYRASARLVCWLAREFSVPKDREHILGHAEADPGTTHSLCPNSVWDWDKFMQLVTDGSCDPPPVAAQPQGWINPSRPALIGSSGGFSRPLGPTSFALFWNDVPLIAQGTTQAPSGQSVSAWVAAAAMIAAWRDRVSNPLDPYDPQSRNRFHPVDGAQLAGAWGLQVEPPRGYSVDSFRSVLQNYGPVFVSRTNVPGDHAVVVTGIYGDGQAEDTLVRFHDPAGYGLVNREYTFADFMAQMGNPSLILHAGGTRGRQPASPAQAFAGQLAFSAFDGSAVERMRQEFVANVAAGSPKSCIIITNAGLRQLFGPALKNPDGTDKRLGTTIQDTMAALRNYGLAEEPKIFEFNDARGRLTKGVVRPHQLRESIEAWLLSESGQIAQSSWHVFGLSIMDGYHSVVLALDSSGTGHALTKLYWADQIYSGWDDITGALDARITERTQTWWDPLPADRKARTRVTLWPLMPGQPVSLLPAIQARTASHAPRPANVRTRPFTTEGDDGIEGMEEESAVVSRPQQSGECSDTFCPTNSAASASSAHFSLEEFRCRDGTEVPERFRGNVQEVMDNLEVLRTELGQPITINSGYRTCSYNSTLEGAASRSRHLCGQAADIRVAEHTPVQVHAAIERLIGAGRMRQGGLGLYNSFVHYDVRGTEARWDRRTGSTKSLSARGLDHVPGHVVPDYSQVSTFGQAAGLFFDWLLRGLRFGIGVPNTRFFPHSAICKIRAVDGAARVLGQGTGFYIGHNTILTAAHVLWNTGLIKNGFRAEGMEIVPGLNGTDEPFGGASVMGSAATFHPNYNPASYDPSFDVAVVHSAPDAPNGQFFEMEELRMSPMTGIITCGYAGVDVDRTKQHLDVDTIRELHNGTFSYAAQVRQGSSGGPVFYALDDHTIRVVGINVTTLNKHENRGLRLTDPLISWINSV